MIIPKQCHGLANHDLTSRNDVVIRFSFQGMTKQTREIVDQTNPAFETQDTCIFPMNIDSEMQTLHVAICDVDMFHTIQVLHRYDVPIDASMRRSPIDIELKHLDLRVCVVCLYPTKTIDTIQRGLQNQEQTITEMKQLMNIQL